MVLLMVLSIIWGSSFILIKKSLEHFSPYQVGALRVLAGIILMPIAISKYKLFPKKHLKWLILAAFTGNFPMFLFPIVQELYQFHDAYFRDYCGRFGLEV
jgi:drug/metabolite transporter (DMT)-like permease